MAGNTVLPSDRAGLPPPIAAGAAMGAGFPIAIGWTMTTAAQPRALGELQLAAITGLEHLEIVFVMAIETEVIAVMAAVPHDNVGVFLRDYDIVVFVKAQGRGLAPFVTGVTIKVRKVGFGRDELSVGNARSRVAGERGIYQRNGGQCSGVPPDIRDKGSGQPEEAQRQAHQHRRSFGLSLHLILEQSCQMRPFLAQRELAKA
jgi:hypothetical protein